jgi:prepilin-type processing-associated H-X9-DG protein
MVYAGDFQDAIPPNHYNNSSWVPGNLKTASDATNMTLVERAVLWPYNKSYAIYRCPADKINFGDSGLRSRSYSLNSMMGNNNSPVPGDAIPYTNPGNPHYNIPENLKFTSVHNPGPSDASFFVDEQGAPNAPFTDNNTSIDDGYFCVDYTYEQNIWRNVPASRHGNHGQFSYADGHAGIMKWHMPKTQYLMGDSVGVNSSTPYGFGGKDRDLQQLWLSTYPRGGYPSPTSQYW